MMKLFRIDDGETFYVKAENRDLAGHKFYHYIDGGAIYNSKDEFFRERKATIREVDNDQEITIKEEDYDGPEITKTAGEWVTDPDTLNASYGIIGGTVFP
jgi:hypothetical protein